ncbi:hypothetical protein [Sinosporangium siamense]|uniref:Uncharacterized protein n=1 Tax=Sinosporangium siamense TaxID=1367973 RepID=A0A919RND2_9ACTN|nr:hypothetical protein [Sinosporangium siamense]GII96357.1 hypothetical protein Ssi02_65880 [Sinosporangium siamense]
MEHTPQYFDPLVEAAGQGVEQAVHLASVGAVAAQLLLQATTQRLLERATHERATQAELTRQQRAADQAGQRRWRSAFDRRWLAGADVPQVLGVWSAAAPYSASVPEAEQARLRCEVRLREQHPHAMGHYDRFRQADVAPVEAMQRALPFFARDPNVRTGYPPPPRRELLSHPARLAQGDFPYSIAHVVAAGPRTTLPAGRAPAVRPAVPMRCR